MNTNKFISKCRIMFVSEEKSFHKLNKNIKEKKCLLCKKKVTRRSMERHLIKEHHEELKEKTIFFF